MTRKEVLDRIEKETKVFTIKVFGSEKDKDDAFYILMNTQHLVGDKDEIFHGIKQKTLDLLDEAEIKYKIIKGRSIS